MNPTEQPMLLLDELIPPARRLSVVRRRELRLKDLSHWADIQVGRLSRFTNLGRTSEMFLYTQLAKLTEEVGELSAEILARSKLQRTDKMGRYSVEGLESEIADVLICTSIIARMLDIDINEAVGAKVEVLEERFANQR